MSRSTHQLPLTGQRTRRHELFFLSAKFAVAALLLVPAFVVLFPSYIYVNTFSCTTCPPPSWHRSTWFPAFAPSSLLPQAANSVYFTATDQQVVSDSIFKGSLDVSLGATLEIGRDSVSEAYLNGKTNSNGFRPSSLQQLSARRVQYLKMTTCSLNKVDIKTTESIHLGTRDEASIPALAFTTYNLDMREARLHHTNITFLVRHLGIEGCQLKQCNFVALQTISSLDLRNTRLDSVIFDFNVRHLYLDNVVLPSYAKIKVPAVSDIRHLTGSGILELVLNDSASGNKANFEEANRNNGRLPKNYDLFKSVVVIRGSSFSRLKFDPGDIVLKVDSLLDFDHQSALYQRLMDYFKESASARRYYDIEFQKYKDQHKSWLTAYVNDVWLNYGYYGEQTMIAIYQVFAIIFSLKLLFLRFSVPSGRSERLQNVRNAYLTAVNSGFWIRLRSEVWLALVLTLSPLMRSRPDLSEMDLTKVLGVVWYVASSVLWTLLFALAVKALLVEFGL